MATGMRVVAPMMTVAPMTVALPQRTRPTIGFHPMGPSASMGVPAPAEGAEVVPVPSPSPTLASATPHSASRASPLRGRRSSACHPLRNLSEHSPRNRPRP